MPGGTLGEAHASSAPVSTGERVEKFRADEHHPNSRDRFVPDVVHSFALNVHGRHGLSQEWRSPDCEANDEKEGGRKQDTSVRCIPMKVLTESLNYLVFKLKLSDHWAGRNLLDCPTAWHGA